MNILLFKHDDIVSQSENEKIIRIKDQRFKHLLSRKYQTNDSLRVAELNGLCGQGVINIIEQDYMEINCKLHNKPPSPAPAKLILALPRPKMLRRLLVDIAMLGIKDIILLASTHVQKSYWSSPLLKKESILNYLLKGLEQSCDSAIPKVTLENRFLPFVEDRLSDFAIGDIILAHPNASELCPQPAKNSFTLIVGPENGFTDYEVNKFIQQKAKTYTLGARHLRVETAATYLLGRLLP